MCTVSVIPLAGSGLRLVTNRDVQRSRLPASPPAWHDLTDPTSRTVRAVWPTDADAGGTWVAANSSALVLCLLNKTVTDAEYHDLPTPSRSRGDLIPDLITGASAGDAIGRLQAFENEGRLADYDCFRMVATAPGSVGDGVPGPIVIESAWDRRGLHTQLHVGPAVAWASSGLGDELVQRRIPLFREMVAPDPTPVAQDAFHGFRWDESPELSPLMSRADARSVSITTVEVGPGVGTAGVGVPGVEMRHVDLAEGDPAVDPVGAAATG